MIQSSSNKKFNICYWFRWFFTG